MVPARIFVPDTGPTRESAGYPEGLLTVHFTTKKDKKNHMQMANSLLTAYFRHKNKEKGVKYC